MKRFRPRVTWRWNAWPVWQWCLRFSELDCVRDLRGVRFAPFRFLPAERPANDVQPWGRA